jgi:iron complex transport system substrate-binding protein
MVYALGLQEQLYGVTFECDYPPEARAKPKAVRSVFGEAQLSSGEISQLIGQRLKDGLGIYDIDQDVLRAAAPDLLLSQAICDVCAVSTQQVVDASLALPHQPTILSLDPQCLADVLENIWRVARATGSEAVAAPLVASLQARIDAVQTTAAQVIERPRVLHLEWSEPLMCGGHWVPEMVELAGGVNCFGDQHSNSLRLEWEEIVASQPDIILVMLCGFDVSRALQDLPLFTQREGWATLPAVQQQRVYIIDGNAYTSRSGPRLVCGLEIIAEMLHPALFSGLIPAGGGIRLSAAQLAATPLA